MKTIETITINGEEVQFFGNFNAIEAIERVDTGVNFAVCFEKNSTQELESFLVFKREERTGILRVLVRDSVNPDEYYFAVPIKDSGELVFATHGTTGKKMIKILPEEENEFILHSRIEGRTACEKFRILNRKRTVGVNEFKEIIKEESEIIRKIISEAAQKTVRVFTVEKDKINIFDGSINMLLNNLEEKAMQNTRRRKIENHVIIMGAACCPFLFYVSPYALFRSKEINDIYDIKAGLVKNKQNVIAMIGFAFLFVSCVMGTIARSVLETEENFAIVLWDSSLFLTFAGSLCVALSFPIPILSRERTEREAFNSLFKAHSRNLHRINVGKECMEYKRHISNQQLTATRAMMAARAIMVRNADNELEVLIHTS